jgi:hypothetical protein
MVDHASLGAMLAATAIFAMLDTIPHHPLRPHRWSRCVDYQRINVCRAYLNDTSKEEGNDLPHLIMG